MAVRVFHLEVPAEANCLKAVRAFVAAMLHQHRCDDPDDLVLALDEACANVVRHRRESIGDRRLAVTIELGDELLRCRIRAFCAEQDVERIRPRDLADVRPGGLGTHFIATIMDRVAFEPDPDHPGAMAIVLERRWPTREEP